MTETESYILTQRKLKLMKLIAKEFSLPKSKRGDVADLHNRLARIKDWLKEPVVKNVAEPIYIPTRSPLTQQQLTEVLFPSDKIHISNSEFKTNIGFIKIAT